MIDTATALLGHAHDTTARDTRTCSAPNWRRFGDSYRGRQRAVAGRWRGQLRAVAPRSGRQLHNMHRHSKDVSQPHTLNGRALRLDAIHTHDARTLFVTGSVLIGLVCQRGKAALPRLVCGLSAHARVPSAPTLKGKQLAGMRKWCAPGQPTHSHSLTHSLTWSSGCAKARWQSHACAASLLPRASHRGRCARSTKGRGQQTGKRANNGKRNECS